MQMKTTAECMYLDGDFTAGSLGPLKQMQLYHSHDARGRAIWCLHLTADSRSIPPSFLPSMF